MLSLVSLSYRPCGLASFVLITISICAAYAQPAPVSGSCSVTAVPTPLRAESLAEPIGDIVIQCSGSTPGAVLNGTLSVTLPAGITNRVDSNNQTASIVLSVDYGSGFVPTGIPAQISGQFLSFKNLSLTIPPSGNLNLKISNIRIAASQIGASQQISAQLTFNSTSSILVNQSRVTVGFTVTGLLATLSNRGVINCAGSPVPSTINLSSLFAAGTIFSSTRLTEGFANSFRPRGAGDDTGTRFLLKYSGFPSNTHLYLPDFVAGSSAAAPTAAGDLGLPQQVGQYVPGSNTLLLARVQFTDPAGAGGVISGLPAGSSSVTLNSVSEVPLSAGSGYAVYEVVDANANLQETVQFPVFVGLSDVTAPAQAQQTVSLAPVSTVAAASPTAPVPRFAALPISSDCNLLNDCNANYFPHLSVLPNPVTLAAIAGGAMTSQPGYIPIGNSGGGLMPWTTAVNYANGSGWLMLDYTSGVNNGSVRLWAKAQPLSAGTYRAEVVINAGSAGSATIPVTLTVSAAPAPGTGSGSGETRPNPPASTPVTVSQVVNAATFQATPVVSGSIGTLMGSNLAGALVTVAIDGLPAAILYNSAQQINFQLPSDLGSKTSAQLVVTVDGKASAPYTVALSPAWPSIFAGGVLNQDSALNGRQTPAAPGSVLQIFATGVPSSATVSITIGGRDGLVPLYAGPAPSVPGVQQVNVAIPETASGDVDLTVCATAAGRQFCSAAYSIAVK